jgi:malate synthase
MDLRRKTLSQRIKIMSVSAFHNAADRFGALFMLLMGLATGGAMAVVGL